MNADIIKIDETRRAAYAFAPANVDDATEQQWYAAIHKSCSRGVCRAGAAGHLIEFLALSVEKRNAMGMDTDKTGFLLGFIVRDPDVWKRIASGEIDICQVTVDGAGVGVEFPQQQLSKAVKSEEVVTMEESDGSVFRISKSDPNFELIAKCVGAVQSGHLGTLTQHHFEKALDAVAQSYAQEEGIPITDAADAVLRTELGSKLYSGYVAAPVAKAEQPVAKVEEAPACCRAINRAAEALQDRDPSLTKEQAVAKAMDQNPSLYTDYLDAQG